MTSRRIRQLHEAAAPSNIAERDRIHELKRGLEELGIWVRDTAQSYCAEKLPIISEQYAKLSVAEPHRLCEHRVEHWRQVAWRGIDDPQHFGGRGLLLTRFSKFSLTLGKPTL